MIFKIQRPLSSSDADPPCLIYNKDRSIEFFANFPAEDFRELFPHNEFKVYVEADMRGNDIMKFTKIKDQGW